MDRKYLEYRQLDLPFIEKEYLSIWETEKTFHKSVKHREGSEHFVFYEGPPSANGMPGIHHVISRTLKDMVCRYKTMQGYQVKRKAGWDTHGLPVELGEEKELGITKEDIGVSISVEEYNKKCREAVMRYKKEWDTLTQKMGYWVDLDDPYITFDIKYIESLWWVLKKLFEKNLLYKSVSIQPYSPAAGTGLSSHELNQPDTYKNVKDTTVVAMFEMIPDALTQPLENAVKATGAKAEDVKIHFLAWTTTPWTLPSNCGLTVGPDITYALVHTVNPYTHQPIWVVLAEALIPSFFKAEGENQDIAAYSPNDKIIPWRKLYTCKGNDLVGIRYHQLIPYEGNSKEVAGGDPWRVIPGDFVTTEDGTGIVHTAPAFGADDYRVGQKHNIGMLTLVDKEGKFLENLGPLSGRYVKNYKDDQDWKDVDIDIAVALKQAGKAFKVEKYEHSYPHCWRTDKPVIYYPLDAWFIKTTALKDRMVELNKTINWKPKSTGEGRFGNWLENMVDWNLSRSRFWGTPLPVWVSENGTEIKCIGSIDELLQEVETANQILGLNQLTDVLEAWKGNIMTDLANKIGITSNEDKYKLLEGKLDLHKPYVDNLILCDSQGKPMRREPDLVDVWFDSGAMPYAQWHYPFENKKDFKNSFPADFIAEGVDQTRGWFYTLHALAVMLFDSVAYKTVVSNGLVLDKHGNKMSKRLGNAIDPFETIEKYSADATRWYLVTNASPWDSLRFDIEGIKEVQRKYFGTLFNTYQFFALYANVDGFVFKERYIPLHQRPEIDQWILSELNSLVAAVNRFMDDYEPTQAGRAMEYFLDEQLSNWYVRLCRRRFWKGEYEHDKVCAYQTLYECLETIAGLMAPIAPFFADWLYRNLNQVTQRKEATSVHLSDFPQADESAINTELEERMKLAQDISSLVLSLRKKVNIKVRQPLQKVMVPVLDKHMQDQIQKVATLIKNEVNVKEIEYLDDSQGFIKKKLKPNFKLLGARMGAKMKMVAAAIQQMDQTAIAHLEKEQQYTLELEDTTSVSIQLQDVEVIPEDIPGWSVANKGSLTVALDTTITPELLDEGIAREFINRVQKLRKDSGFELIDKIIVKVISDDEALRTAIIKYNDYICAEILAHSIQFGEDAEAESAQKVEVNEKELKVLLHKKT